MRKNRLGTTGISLAAFALIATASPALATTLEDLGLPEEINQQIREQASTWAPRSSPGVAFGSPIGYGTGYGDFYAAVGGRTLSDDAEDDVDGSAYFGVGIGDPYRWIALDVTANIISIYGDPGHDGSFNLKLHHALPYSIGIAIGVENVGRWGDAKQTKSSNFAAVTKLFGLSSSMVLGLNAGVGDRDFDEFQTSGEEGGMAAFGGAALVIANRVSVIADWTGRDLNAGVSVVPVRSWPVTVTAGMINLTERNGATSAFAGTLSYTFVY